MAKAHLTGKPHHKKLKVLGLPVPEICVDKKFPSTAKYQLEIECSASVESKMLTFVVFVVKKHSMFVKTVKAQHHTLTITRSVISEFKHQGHLTTRDSATQFLQFDLFFCNHW